MSLRSLAFLFLLFVPACASPEPASREPVSSGPSRISAAVGTTTVMVVRHAEKATDDPRDPSLNAEGQRRAQDLASALGDARVTALYATQYRRTRSTAEPLAARLGLSVEERPVASGDVDGYARELAQEILSKHRSGAVVVVGHSNTVPAIVEALSGRKVAPISDAEYDHLFVVTIPPEGSPPRLLRARYGAASAVAPQP